MSILLVLLGLWLLFVGLDTVHNGLNYNKKTVVGKDSLNSTDVHPN